MNHSITVDRGDFSRALGIASSVVNKRDCATILGTVKVEANGALRLAATNLDTNAIVEIGYRGKPLTAFALKHPHQIAKALRHLGDDRLVLHEPVANDKGSSKKLQISSGQFDSHLSTMPADDFPIPNAIGHEEFGVDLGASAIAALARIMPAISTEEVRYYLNGVCAERISEWMYRFVATDGHRLMMVDVPLPGAVGIIPDRTIIPRGFMKVVMKHFSRTKDPVRLTYGRCLMANKPDVDLAPHPTGMPLIAMAGKVGPASLTLSSKLIDGTYPDYNRAFPKILAHTLRLQKADLIKAVQGLSPLRSANVRALRLEAVEGGVRISLHSHNLGDASFVIPAEHGLPHETMIVAFNGNYLLDCLRALTGEEVQFDMTADHCSDPATIHDPADTAFRCVLMPMRV